MSATDDNAPVMLSVERGRVVVSGTEGEAALSWPAHGVVVRVSGEQPAGTRTRVRAGDVVEVEVEQREPRCEYIAAPSRNRMEATLRVRTEPGIARELEDAPASRDLRLVVSQSVLEPPEPSVPAALAAVQEAGISFGVDREAIEAAVAEPNVEHRIAEGRDPVEGRDGYVQPMIDFEECRRTGVAQETPLLRSVRKRDGRPGMDVTGRELRVRPVREPRLQLGEGVAKDPGGLIVLAKRDGLPVYDGESFIEVRSELELEDVDTAVGDIEFCGSVRITGNVHPGRRVIARRCLVVEGNVDRAQLEAGDRIEVLGSVMSSTLRAGGDRAVAAGMMEHVEELPRQLVDAATRARELRDAAEKRGTPISHGLSVQLVMERLYRPALSSLEEAATLLSEAGPQHLEVADCFRRWHRQLSTAAVSNLGAGEFMEILNGLGQQVDAMRNAVESSADLVVTYMQSCEAEATGTVTLAGKGIFNSRIVAWRGMQGDHPKAVVRGGSITSHGPIDIAELGSPGGSAMQVQLGKQASLTADVVYSGTVVSGPGHIHRFIADRSHVKIGMSNGQMDVQSLAA